VERTQGNNQAEDTGTNQQVTLVGANDYPRFLHVFPAKAKPSLKTKAARDIPIHGIIDSGSTHNFVTEDLVKQMDTKLHHTNTSATGIGGIQTNVSQTATFFLTVQDAQGQRRDEEIVAFVVPSIAGQVYTLPPEFVDNRR